VACESDDVRRRLSSEHVRVVDRADAISALVTVASEHTTA
jgi:hypothetical protein